MRRLALALALTVAAATPAVAGPPWLTLEFRPGNFAGFMMVRTFHHGTPEAFPLTGTAEGLVNGRRVSVPLRFERAEEPNAFTVARSWGITGVWVLNLSTEGDHIGAGGVVGIDRNGDVAFTRFPRTAVGASRAATPGEVEALLRALDGNTAPPILGTTGWIFVALRTMLPLLILSLLALGVVKIVAALAVRARRRTAATVTAALAAMLAVAIPAVAGGPWISVELPANPYSSRGAFVVVHTYLHQTPAPFVVTGSAEGLVNGQRRSLPLTITSTGQGGSMAIMKTWPSEGVWVLKLGVDGMELGAAIGVGAGGEVVFVRVPVTRSGATRNLAAAEVETLLRALQAGQQAPALQAAE